MKRRYKSIALLLVVALLFCGCSLLNDDYDVDDTAPIVLNPQDKQEDTGRVLIDGDVDEDYVFDDGEKVVVREKFYVEQINEIYYNFTDYLGRTIEYEGLFMPEYDNYFDEEIYYVYRYGPGCCGTDANAGFEVAWDGQYPEPDDWVRCTGVLVHYEQEGLYFVRLELSELEVLDERGLETVEANPEYGGGHDWS